MNSGQKSVKDTATKKSPNSLYVLILVGVLISAVLLLLQTGFKEFFRMDRGGYAITQENLTKSLVMQPGDDGIEKKVDLYHFDPLDYIYQQGNRLYLGISQKVQLQNAFPLYTEDDAAVQVINDESKLFDVNFEEVETYEGLILLGKSAFNRDGNKADAAEYLFLRLSNGNYVNLTPITYRVKGVDYDIDVNSIIHFEKNYFSYYEIVRGTAIYKSNERILYSDVLTLNNEEYSYENLLLLLRVIEPSNVKKTPKSEEPSEFESIQEVSEQVTLSEEPVSVRTSEDKEEESVSEPESIPEKKQKPPKEKKEKDQSSEPSSEPRGVRPDELRPDKPPEGEGKPPVVNYEKPTASVTQIDAYVYRISLEVVVKDPAQRIHKQRKLQVEVYEVNGSDQELVMRSYKGAPGGIVELGGGSVKPGTKYRVKTVLTYYNEYDNVVSDLIDDTTVTTDGIDTLSAINLVHKQGDVYHNKIQVAELGYSGGSDDEAIYGISPAGGIQINVKAQVGSNTTKIVFDRLSTKTFKSGGSITGTSASLLQAKSMYDYEIVLTDFFNNVLPVTNATGSANTCKNPPIATMELSKNAISDVQISAKITDEDLSFIPSATGDGSLDIYFAVLKENETIASVEHLSDAVFYQKVDSSQYTYSDVDGQMTFSMTDESMLFTMEDLRLDEQYRAVVFADYDLDNREGQQRFCEIGELKFKAAGLSSLGNIYIKGKISDITAQGVTLDFELDKQKTNTSLAELVTDFKVTLTTAEVAGDDDADSVAAEVGFNSETPANYEGYTYLYEIFREGITFRSVIDNELQSMTQYMLNPYAKCTYLNEKYDVNTILNISGFKTLRKEPTVTVFDPIFAGGQIVFDTRVLDEDDTITGNSGSKVVLSLYRYTKVVDEEGNEQEIPVFVKKTRISKVRNRDDLTLTNVIFDNLDMEAMYYVSFTAVEYNDGYTNDRFQANKEIHREYFNEGINYTGTIRLQDLRNIDVNAESVRGDFIISFVDPLDSIAAISSKNEDYFVGIEKYKGKDGTALDVKELGFEKVVGENSIDWNQDFEKGNYKYHLTLYVKIGARVLKLDEITFTTEQEIKGFSDTYQFISYIKENPKGKYVATNDIVLESDKTYYPIDGVESSGRAYMGNSITSIFNGQIDFQGYTLEHHFRADGQRMFDNIGPNGRINNLVYDVYWDCEAVVSEDACMTYRNYGSISNIFLNYKGGSSLPNTTVGVITRVNAATGVIENFVVNHTPEEGKSGFSVKRYGGIICYNNYGVVRNGYIYGSDLYCAHTVESSIVKASSFPRYIGALVGYNISIGKVENVYSLVGLQMEPYINLWTGGNGYGNIVGYSSGYTGNMYCTKDSTNIDKIGPAVGTISGSKYENVYYWSQSKKKYTSVWSKEASVENLYDTGWQKRILGKQFNAVNVETGFYPHVILSSNLPQQRYIELPQRSLENMVDITQTEVISYDNTQGSENALVRFRFSNNYNAEIQTITVDSLQVELNYDSAVSEDGYTVMEGVVSNPTKFLSSYPITDISYTYNSRLSHTHYDAGSEPQLIVDFYRNVYSVDDWYEYVVKMAKNNRTLETQENVRLRSNLDFTDVVPGRIKVEYTWFAKIDGDGHKIQNIKLIDSYNTRYNGSVNNLFTASTSIAMSGSVENLIIENYSCGGFKAGYSATQGAVFRKVVGDVKNVHLINAEVVGYESLGGITSRSSDGSVISDCTVNNLTIVYTEPNKLETDCAIGGLVGSASDSRISNCYVKNISIKANDMKTCNGIGGLCGYAYNSVIDSVYATGEIESRGNKTGGIVGQYKSTNEAMVCVSNAIAKVNIVGYTDMIGGLIGCANITSDMISDTNNISGLALGDVYAYNPDAEGVSQTVGTIISRPITFFGCETQLLNGMLSESQPINTISCRGLLTYDEIKTASTYTDKMEFGDVYNLSPVTDGNLPHLYYSGTATELPYQGKDGFDEVALNTQKQLGIEVRDIVTYSNSNLIRLQLKVDGGWKVKKIKIEDLKYSEDYVIEETQTPGVVMVYITYDEEIKQEHFLDSYVLSSITAEKDGRQEVMSIACRVPITMYKEISQASEWCNIDTEYENYRIVDDLDFIGLSGYENKRIGRVVGRNLNNSINGSIARLSNIQITSTCSNFISRLNSSMSNLEFDHVVIKNGGKDCIGLVGTSYGKVEKVKFNDISIQPTGTSALKFIGIIAYQNGSMITDVECINISINADKLTKFTYMGSLCGNIADVGKVQNVTLSDSNVYGASYCGGLVGTSYCISYENIKVSDTNVISNGDYVGGMVGRLGSDSNCIGALIVDIEIQGDMINTDSGVVLDKTLVSNNGCEIGQWGDTVKTGAESTSTIKGNSNVGAVAGRAYTTTGVYKPKPEDNGSTKGMPYVISVVGCKVEGTGNYVGGAYGYATYYTYWTNISDSYIHGEATGKKVESVGGISGCQLYRLAYCNVRNTLIETQNYFNIGGVVGSQAYHDIRYSSVQNCNIKCVGETEEYQNGTLENVGGVVGYVYGGAAIYFDGFINSVIDANQLKNVGGVVGLLNNGISSGNSCAYNFVVGAFDTSKEDTTEAARAKDAYMVKGYTNVGSIIGYQYSGKVYYCESNINVIAESSNTSSIAGGITGFYDNSYVVNTNRTKTYSIAGMYRNYFAGSVSAYKYAGGLIGRTGLMQVVQSDNPQRVSGTTGSLDEGSYTYGNVLLPFSVKAQTVNSVDGESSLFTGKGTRVWADSLLNGECAYDVMNGYSTWSATRDGGWTISAPLRIFTSQDLLNYKFYYNVNWIGGPSTYNGYWRTMIPGLRSGNSYHYSDSITKASLPSVRNNTNAYKEDDLNYYVVKIQQYFMKSLDKDVLTEWIPIPKKSRDYEQRTMSLAANGSVPKVSIYPSDVDKVNLEFDKEYIFNESGKNGGYFVVMQNGVEVCKELITKRVYTFNFDFSSDFTVTYGEAVKNDDGDTYAYYPYNERNVSAKELSKTIMVSGGNYYYIKAGELVKGSADNRTILGTDYLHLMNGKAIGLNKTVIDLNTMQEISAISEMKEIETVPLHEYSYSGYRILTFYTFTEVIGNQLVERPVQMFVHNGQLYTVDDRVNNVKNEVLIYKKDSLHYQTILSNDGVLIDMMQEEPSFPESLPNSAIADMTDNLDATAPYALVLYGNGGLAGYNYLTGDVLFDETIRENISFADYVRSVFNGDKDSMLHGISETYNRNARLSQELHSEADCEKLFKNHSGNNSDQEPTITNANGNGDVQGSGESTAQGNVFDKKGEAGGEDVGAEVGSDLGEGPIVDGTGDVEGTGVGEVSGTSGNSSSGKITNGTADNQGNGHKNSGAIGGNDSSTASKSSEETTEEKEHILDDSKQKGYIPDTLLIPSDTKTLNEQVAVNKQNTKETIYMVVFNASTGIYEIVSETEYLGNQSYFSENARMGVADLAEFSGYAVADKRSKNADGLTLYLVVALVTLLGAASMVYVWERKKRKKE